jgi:hypothetical protein
MALKKESKIENIRNEKLVYEYFRLHGLINEDDYFTKKKYWVKKHIELKNKFLELKKSNYYNCSILDNKICSLLKEYYSEFPSILLFIYNHKSRFGDIIDIIDDLRNQPNVYKSV